MDSLRVRCTDCENMILPETDTANAGLCGPCAKLSEELRVARTEYQQRLSSGEIFRPSPAELSTARSLAELAYPSALWYPNPDSYRDSPTLTTQELISRTSEEVSESIFLVSENGASLNVTFNERYGVCEYRDETSNLQLYAYTSENMTQQVSEEWQIGQPCACCGVWLLTYPSRFHMPRKDALGILRLMALGESKTSTPKVEWLTCGDISDTEDGKG
ncbi:MAG: hypothetical protein ACRC8S_07130 [Fimbriiglobus sp.]